MINAKDAKKLALEKFQGKQQKVDEYITDVLEKWEPDATESNGFRITFAKEDFPILAWFCCDIQFICDEVNKVAVPILKEAGYTFIKAHIVENPVVTPYVVLNFSIGEDVK